VRDQVCLPPRHRAGPTSTHNWLKRASSRLSSRMAKSFALVDGELYKRTASGVLQ
jgi:hypothetical protein